MVKLFLKFFTKNKNFFSYLKNHPGFVKYFKNTSWSFFHRMINFAVGFFVSIQVARYLGPVDLGYLTYAQALIGFIMVFSDLGILGILTRELVNRSDKTEELLFASFLIIWVVSLALFILTSLIIIFWPGEEVTQLLLLYMSFALLFTSISILNKYYESIAKLKYSSLSLIFTFLIISALKIIFILLEFSVIYFGLFFSLEYLLQVFFLLHYYGWKKFFSYRKINRALILNLVKLGLPFLTTSLIAFFFNNIVQVLLKNLLSAEKLGIYTIGIKLPTVYSAINGIIFTAIFPALINAKKKSQGLYLSRIKKVFSLVIYLSLFFSLITFIFSDTIIYFLYGGSFKESIEVLQIYVWTTVLSTIHFSISNWLIIENQLKYLVMNNLISGIFNVSLSFILIEKYGLMGVVWAQLFYLLFSSYFFYCFIPKTRIVFKLITQSFFPYFLTKLREF